MTPAACETVTMAVVFIPRYVSNGFTFHFIQHLTRKDKFRGFISMIPICVTERMFFLIKKMIWIYCIYFNIRLQKRENLA